MVDLVCLCGMLLEEEFLGGGGWDGKGVYDMLRVGGLLFRVV